MRRCTLLPAAARPGNRGGFRIGQEHHRESRSSRRCRTGRASSSSRTTTTGRSRTCRAAERASVNYDHPDALELDLLTQHLDALRTGQSIVRPTYDFTTHDRAKEGLRVDPAPIIVVEGILVLADDRLRSRFEVKLFVDTDPDIRLMRRIRRDLEHRGRTFAQVRKQYYESVRPMHLAFVEPSKRFADIIIPEGGQNRVALDFLLSFVRQKRRPRAVR